ncbi:MAG: dienelactone hydrolase family protein [Ferrovibrionaceae bacterium]
MTGSYIDITAADGGRFKAYMARPAKGSGPGLVLAQEIFGINPYMQAMADRFAEEGYVVLVPDLFWRLEPGVVLGYGEADFAKAIDLYQRLDVGRAVDDIAATVSALRAQPGQAGGVGVLGYCLGGKLAYLAAARAGVDCAISYYGVGIENDLALGADIKCPMVIHIAEKDGYCPTAAQDAIKAAFADRSDVEIYVYPGCDHAFATPGRPQFDKPATLMAYSRSLALLRKVLGPKYDLSHLWDMHCYYEFATRDVNATMATMVAEPYVNHVPTMTGGVGHDHLKRFYTHHFVNSNPEDTKLIPISRTIGTDRLVDEMLFCFTHTREIDWMLPGVPPTGKYVEVPLVGIICFRGDKLYNEHIYWDQASVLVQIGLLDPKLLPVAGIETAKKLVDETLPSNTLMKNWASSEGKPI